MRRVGTEQGQHQRAGSLVEPDRLGTLAEVGDVATREQARAEARLRDVRQTRG